MIKIYQAYYDISQTQQLDSSFIPFDNTKNLTPHLREYPMHKKLFKLNKETNDYWGLVSWRWKEKTNLSSQEFVQWIVENPGYDVYHIDPNLEVTALYQNLWIQGERWHPGILEYANILFPMIGIQQKPESIVYPSEDFATTNYFIGNSKFWTEWFLFLDNILVLSSQNDKLHSYLYKEGSIYNGSWLPYFIFVVERLVSIFFMLNRNIKVKKFSPNHRCFAEKFGNNYKEFLKIYNEKRMCND